MALTHGAMQGGITVQRVEYLLATPENPVIEPVPGNWWESHQTFNPGAVVVGDSVHLLYRAMGWDWVSRWGYARSRDGLTLDERLGYPVYEHRVTSPPQSHHSSGGGLGGAEDPRVVRIGDRIYVTYTAYNGYPRVALTSISVRDFLERTWRWSRPQVISPPGEVHKNWVIFPEMIEGKYAILHSITPKISIEYLDTLNLEGGYIKSYYNGETNGYARGGWELRVKGAGAPPIKTPLGWLLIYHAIPRDCPDCYAVGAMLLDLEEPEEVVCRASKPLLHPARIPAAMKGFKGGVVYTNGAVVKDGTLYIYYGAADTVTCVAYTKLEGLLKALASDCGERYGGVGI